jgi:hypothetical protein
VAVSVEREIKSCESLSRDGSAWNKEPVKATSIGTPEPSVATQLCRRLPVLLLAAKRPHCYAIPGSIRAISPCATPA